jgi:hypothetical protein
MDLLRPFYWNANARWNIFFNLLFIRQTNERKAFDSEAQYMFG